LTTTRDDRKADFALARQQPHDGVEKRLAGAVGADHRDYAPAATDNDTLDHLGLP
jgi:hypothetical protein